MRYLKSFNESKKDIESNKYKLVFQPDGAWYLIDKKNGKETLLNTGVESIEEYKLLKRLLRKGDAFFNDEVKKTYIFESSIIKALEENGGELKSKDLLIKSGYNMDNMDSVFMFYSDLSELEKKGKVKESRDKSKIILIK